MSLLIDILKDIEGKPSTNFPKASNARSGVIKRRTGYHYVVKFFLAMVFCGAFLSCAYYLYSYFVVNHRMGGITTHKTILVSAIPPTPSMTVASQDRQTLTRTVVEIEEPHIDLGPMIDEQPFVIDNKSDYTEIYKRFNPPSDEEIKTETYRLAIEQATDGHWEKAIVSLEDLLRRYPNFNQARESLAAFYVRQGDLPLARKLLDDGIKNYAPDYVPFIRMQAHLLEKLGEYRDALALLKRVNPDIYRQPEYYALMAVLYEKLGQIDKAGSLYQALVRIHPNNGNYWLGLAVSLEGVNRINGAIAAYQHVLDSYQVKPILQMYAERRIKTLKGYG